MLVAAGKEEAFANFCANLAAASAEVSFEVPTPAGCSVATMHADRPICHCSLPCGVEIVRQLDGTSA
ncbi:hypothetical protein GCM10011519_18120 [Marmoricola endophyticus]|uniref:Uncharacterized protein n=1 Tax=Marmoricola endophyticus TaxID=2040280 RepID=A0A917BJ43_9ACTN|nr:hypothetical protein GCM10011519_18120 [Marmoricola endophyticus]